VKIPLSWLAEFITLPDLSTAELADVIAMVGHEVEGYEVLEVGWSGVVVGQVVDIEAHPDADKIRVCQVDVGAGPEQIICGAWNFESGAYVAVARPGAVLPGGFEIGRRTIRGVDSNGMICSDRELGLGDDHTGILVLDGEPNLGIDFSELVELPDVVFDITVTPNRPDAMSLRGIARDLGAYLDIEYRTPERALNTVPGATDIEIELGDPVGCRRFTAREIRGVTIGKSPLWVRHRLAKAGMRAISNVVDVTNYVMLELGHPLHSFDADSIVGRHLIVKRAVSGEQLVTLDDETRTLTDEDLIIYDDAGPTSMSGTMGGARSEVSGETVNVLMEAASWDPPTIMYMSRRHNLRSEASTRFERGVDPNLADEANRRATAMVAELAGGEVPEGAIDVVGTVVEPASITFALAEVTRLLGPGFTHDEVAGILTRLGMRVEGDDPMEVVVPTFRPGEHGTYQARFVLGERVHPFVHPPTTRTVSQKSAIDGNCDEPRRSRRSASRTQSRGKRWNSSAARTASPGRRGPVENQDGEPSGECRPDENHGCEDQGARAFEEHPAAVQGPAHDGVERWNLVERHFHDESRRLPAQKGALQEQSHRRRHDDADHV
jgi:phenylalanyl-tRNA synthetase beta chain